MFWVISVYFNVRNILPKSETFPSGDLYIHAHECTNIYIYMHITVRYLRTQQSIEHVLYPGYWRLNFRLYSKPEDDFKLQIGKDL